MMAHVKKGHLVRAPQWWKHLRDWKRVFWKKHRKAERRLSNEKASTHSA
jgi:hypothetical protein